ncbi:hypothetical protein [Idiomarina sp.]|uniref:hypothetical protein n=1 Tax=Idiomarina sp. TaxID=1874361 RepID=UPI00258C7DCB|nr:hypothetical protein [Idiomarina sp.]
MAEVQAVKDLDTVKLISYLLKRTYGQQIADVWDVGLNLALRISDLLSIKFENIARVMKMLRHSSEAVTLRYIGITQEDVDRDFAELEL